MTSKLTKQQMSDAINQALGMHVDWTKLAMNDLVAFFERFSDRTKAAGQIAGSILGDVVSGLAGRARGRVEQIATEFFQGGQNEQPK